jgi:predicted MFS family arabinose efflux permease
MINIAIPSIIALEYPLEQEKYMGYISLAMGAGLCLGPVIGALVYPYFHYIGTFYFFAAYICIIGCSAICFLPKKINNTESETNNEVGREVSICGMLSRSEIVLAMACCTFAMLNIFYFDPILSLQLISEGLNPDNVGYAFAVLGGSFAGGAPVVGWICGKLRGQTVM